MASRRTFLASAAAALAVSASAREREAGGRCEEISLDGLWSFRIDADKAWQTVSVPHTWQIEPATADYMGVAWYRREFDAPAAWAGHAVRVEFEAVFHTATVLLNGAEVGRHVGKGYTAFTCDLQRQLQLGRPNTLLVRVDNSFSDTMLPRGRSSDWAHDGGIYRPVRLLVTPATFVQQVDVDADPDLATNVAALQVSAMIRNATLRDARNDVRAALTVIDEATGNSVALDGLLQVESFASFSTIVSFTARIHAPKLWHFDHPNLYRARVTLSNGHALETTFGVRRIETRGAAFYLNGERVRLMGVERMAGSNPEFGMAEPAEWIAHDHADMKELNAVYTRVHWPQDRRVLDWCDRHGILIQTEVPTWGPATFREKTAEPLPALMNNGLEQLREMIARDRNHPCIFSWGVCNEVNGQNPPAYAFAKRMRDEAKKLDPRRLVTYASNSLERSQREDVSALMDYVMWNEYYETWYAGTVADMARNLDEIHRAFPDKPIVISEYGYCACTADRPEGDARRTEILRGHDREFRERDYVAGLIFFDYNDYRTHVGDRGTGVMKQRVHGVVDVYGARKPSWETLRTEASPIEQMTLEGTPAELRVALKTRSAVPSYTLRGYEIRAVAYGAGDIPVERIGAVLETAAPGDSRTQRLVFTQPGITRIRVDLMRPTGFTAFTTTWTPHTTT